MFFYLTASHTNLAGKPKSEEQENNIKTIKEALKDVEFFAKSPCVDSLIFLVDAELARLESQGGAEDIENVKRLYDKAINSAKEREVTSTLGLANELALKYCLGINDIRCVSQS